MKNVVTCDNQDCKKDFKINPEYTHLGGGIEQIFFKCPYCKKQYPVTKQNTEIKELAKRISRGYDRAAMMKASPEKTSLLESIQELVTEKKRLMEELNKKF